MTKRALTGYDGDADRGVSDLVAFTLTFAIIISAVGVVSLFGIDTLEQIGESERVENAEASLQGFDAAVTDVQADGVPRRSVEFDLGGDSLSLRSSTTDVTVSDDTGTDVYDQTHTVGSFVRETGEETDMVYTSGATFRVQERGAVVLGKPSFRCGPDTAHVSLVRLTGDVDVSSQNRVAMSIESTETTSAYPDPLAGETGEASTVTLDVTDPNSDAWDRMELPGWSRSGTTYTCTDVRKAFVHVTVVELQAVG